MNIYPAPQKAPSGSTGCPLGEHEVVQNEFSTESPAWKAGCGVYSVAFGISMMWLRYSLVAILFIAITGFTRDIQDKHTSSDPMKCKRCQTAYNKALDHTLKQLQRAYFPAKMVMGWQLLADGRHPKELESVVDTAIKWQTNPGVKNDHAKNWYPALAGIFLAEYEKHHPSEKVRDVLKEIVVYFEKVREPTGGWFKWQNGAFKNGKQVYPVKDLGMLTSIIFGYLWTVKTLGISVPDKMLEQADECLLNNLSKRGLSYGTGQKGGDGTGARGAFVLLGLAYANKMKHKIAETYTTLLPQCIPKMDKGHHVGALHGLGVVLGCHVLGPEVYKKLTEQWLDVLIDKQVSDGGIYIGDDGDAGGEKGLFGEDNGSTAAAALLILLQDHTRLKPAKPKDK